MIKEDKYTQQWGIQYHFSNAYTGVSADVGSLVKTLAEEKSWKFERLKSDSNFRELGYLTTGFCTYLLKEVPSLRVAFFDKDGSELVDNYEIHRKVFDEIRDLISADITKQQAEDDWWQAD